MLYDPSDPPRPPPPLPSTAPVPDPAADEAFLRMLQSKPAATVRQLRVRNVALFALAAGFVAELFYWWGGMRAAPRPGYLIVETAVGAACIAAVSTWALFGRRRSMLGRSAIFLGVAGLATPFALFVWKVLASSQQPGMMDLWETRPGFKCLRLSIVMGLFPLLAMALVRKNSDPNHPRLTGASLGVAAGACAWVFTDLWCPVAYVPHLLLGHVLPITVLALLGAALGHLLIGVRAPR
jgi:hypothetical protein